MRLISLCSAMNGLLYSELALAMWPISWTIRRAYGREAAMRTWALRIFDAETISNARVTLRVFCTLLILVLISLPPAIFYSLSEATRRLPGAGRLEVGHGLLEHRLDVLVPGAGLDDALVQIGLGVG